MVASLTSIALIGMAVLATQPTYHVAPLFLIPILWAIYALRRRLNLHRLTYALFGAVLTLHMAGAFGFYQKSPLPFSFDILVHFSFALVITLMLHDLFEGNFPLRPWQVAVMTFFFMMGLAALHEIMEYASYLLLGEARGMLKPTTSYFFDTQRDLVSNLAGTVVALAAKATTHRVR